MQVQRVDVSIGGLTAYSQGGFMEPKRSKESHTQHEERCWRQRMSTDGDGYVVVPPLAIKKAVEAAAAMRSDSIPGKGKQTFTKHVGSGVLPNFDQPQYVLTNGKKILASEVAGKTVPVPPDGKVGGGKRVPKTFPLIQPPWEVEFSFDIFSPELIEHIDRLKDYIELAGVQVGIGCYRPGSLSRGFQGRFRLEKFVVIE
jgi:hypothetical protein